MLYSRASFMATHNSYSGGGVGPITAQLEWGVRVLELDLHADDHGANHDFSIGHDHPGDRVAYGRGNPSSSRLRDWLRAIVDWCERRPDHAPVAIVLDLKRKLDRRRQAELDCLLEEHLGTRLFTPDDACHGWPEIEKLRGRIMTVMSGDQLTRGEYAAGDQRCTFAEHQREESGMIWAPFYAASAGEAGWLAAAQQAGKIVRAWQFDPGRPCAQLPSWPATDCPYDARYVRQLAAAGAVG